MAKLMSEEKLKELLEQVYRTGYAKAKIDTLYGEDFDQKELDKIIVEFMKEV